jgi:hypothetical protein
LYSSPHKSLWRMRCVGAKSTHNINFHWKTWREETTRVYSKVSELSW